MLVRSSRIPTIGFLAAILLLPGAPLHGQPSASAPGPLEQAAEEAFTRDELDLAGALYRQAAAQVTAAAEKARLLVIAGSVYNLDGQRDIALAAVLEALRFEPQYRFRRDLYDESFAALFFEAQRKLLAERDTQAAEAMRQGAAYLHDKDWTKARAAFEKALAQKPDQPRALYNLALANLYLGDRDQALAGFQKLLSLDAASPGTLGTDLRALTLTNLGLIHIEQQTYAEAETALEEAVKLDPAKGAAWSNLGIARRRLGKTLPAADAFRRASELAPNDPGAMNNLALAYIDAKDWISAVALLRTATKVDSKNPSLWLNFGLSQQGLGNEQGALESFEAAIRNDPDNAGGFAAAAALYLAGYHLGLENYAAVQQQASRALGWDPGLVNAWVYQGLAQKGLGDLAAARKSLEKARDLEPTMAEIHNSLGSVYFELGLYDLAESAFELALHLRPDLQDAKANLEAAKEARIRGALGGGRTTSGGKGNGGKSTGAGSTLPTVPEVGLRFSKVDYSSLGLSGLMIETVYPGTPAARAGMLSGDLLLRLDGSQISSEKQLREMLVRLAGRTVSADLLRANRPTTLRLEVP